MTILQMFKNSREFSDNQLKFRGFLNNQLFTFFLNLTKEFHLKPNQCQPVDSSCFQTEFLYCV